jgi:hypothetical protein
MDNCGEKQKEDISATGILVDGLKKKHICKTTDNILFSNFKIQCVRKAAVHL